jgi:hypothetical protein
MVQQHHTLWNVSNEQHQFCPEFDVIVLIFLRATAQKVMWPDSDGESGAHCHSHGGHEMVQQHDTLWNVSNEQHQFCPEFDVEVLNFSPATAQRQKVM